MRIQTLTIAALAWATLGLGSASAEKVLIKKQPIPPQAAEAKSAATSSDPAEPPMQVEVTYVANYGRGGLAAPGQKIEVETGAKGTTLKVPTQGSYTGSADLSFKNVAPPMRFTTRLTGMQNYDLSSLSISSGSVTLQIGQVGTSATTKYFNAKGQAQDTSTGAAYTVRAKRGDNGQVDVELRRGAGATLGKSLSISWQSNIDNIKWGFRGKGG